MAKNQFERAKNYCLFLLGRREYSQFELRGKLGKKFTELANSEVEQLLLQLEEYGWQSDLRFAHSFFRSKVFQKKGPLSIRYEMKAKGVSTSLIAQVFEEETVDWNDLILQIVERKVSPEELEDFKVRHKIYQFLIRKGFSPNQIEKTFQKLRCH